MTKVYFDSLNYSLANEDSQIEYQLCPEHLDSVLTICGSGARVIPLLARSPKHLQVVDLSESQLKLLRLRIAGIKALTYDQYLSLLGYRICSANERLQLFAQLNLPKKDYPFWKFHENEWAHNGFIFLGRWEKHFTLMGKIFVKLTRTKVNNIFNTNDLLTQQKIVSKYWPKNYFTLYCKLALNPWISNKLLYKGYFAGSRNRRTLQVPASQYVSEQFNDLFANTNVAKNFFLQMIFLQRFKTDSSLPLECQYHIFEQVKNNELTQIKYQQGNILECLKQKPHDFYSLSDTFSYMQDEEVTNFLSQIPTDNKERITMVIRSFMRKPYFHIDGYWQTDYSLNELLARLDCTRMYQISVIYKGLSPKDYFMEQL